MSTQSHSFALLPTLAAVAAAATLVLAGCAGTDTAAPAPTPAPTASAPVAPPPSPPPPPAPMVEGLDYAQLGELLGDGSDKRARAAVVGKTTTLTLNRASGRGVPAGTWVVTEGDGTFFRCRATPGGFSGGTVTTKIREYRFVTRSKQKIVDLERCAVAGLAR